MARLPIPGVDVDTWGDILNDYLSVSLDGGGLLKPAVVNDGNVATDAAISESKLSLLSDAAAEVASRRSLGSSALQAAPGNHRHTDHMLKFQTQEVAETEPLPLTIFAFQPSNPERAPFRLVLQGSWFGDQFDHVMTLGYNVGEGGALDKADEPQMMWQIETNYLTNGERWVECFWQYTAPNDAFSLRPVSFTIRRDAAQMKGAVVATALQGDPVWFLNSAGSNMAAITDNRLVVNAPNKNDTTGITLIAASGSPSYIQMGSRGNASALIITAAAANYSYVSVAGQRVLWLYGQTSGGSGRMSFGGVDTRAIATFLVGTEPVGTPGVVVRGREGQAASLFEAQDSGSATLSRLDKNGYFMTRKSTAPADGDLVAGELAIWLDKTPGSSKVMFKAKDSGGAVRTASVDLS